MNRFLPLLLLALLFASFAVLAPKPLPGSNFPKPQAQLAVPSLFGENGTHVSANQLPGNRQGVVQEIVQVDTLGDDTNSNNLIEDVPGPGALLGTLLRTLTIASADSEGRIKNLVSGIPNFIDDLDKVFLTL